MKNKSLVTIMILIVMMAMIAFITNIAAPMGNILKSEFGVDNFQGMLGNGMNFIAYAIMGLPAGIILHKFHYKKTILLAILIAILGILVQFSAGFVHSSMAFNIYLFGAFIAGASVCILNTAVNPALVAISPNKKNRTRYLQIANIFNSLAGLSIPIGIGAIIGHLTNPEISDVSPILLLGVGILTIAFVILLFCKIRVPEHDKRSKKQEKTTSILRKILKIPRFRAGLLAIFIYVGFEVGTPGILNLWANTTVGATEAGILAGCFWGLMLIGRTIGSVLTKWVSSRAMLLSATLATIILTATAILMPQIDVFGIKLSMILLASNGLFASIMWGCIFDLSTANLGKNTAVASGLYMVFVCGGGILPLIQGQLADNFEYLMSYWLIVASLGYILLFAIFTKTKK